MQILLAGASGLVGSYFLQQNRSFLATASKQPQWLAFERSFLCFDVFSLASEHWQDMLSAVSAVIFLAFPTRIDSVEAQSKDEQKRLIDGFANFVKAAKILDKPVLFFSTDAVLWGLPYERRVATARNPKALNTYAALKIACEEILLNAAIDNSYIIRCKPVGLHPFVPNHGFVGSILQNCRQQEVVGYHDAIFNPVALEQLYALVEFWQEGLINAQREALGQFPIVHIGSTDALNKFEFLLPFVQAVGGQIRSASLHEVPWTGQRVEDQRLKPSPIAGFANFTAKDVQAAVARQMQDLRIF